MKRKNKYKTNDIGPNGLIARLKNRRITLLRIKDHPKDMVLHIDSARPNSEKPSCMHTSARKGHVRTSVRLDLETMDRLTTAYLYWRNKNLQDGERKYPNG